MSKLIDRLHRLGLRLAYPVLLFAIKMLRLPITGVYVFIWHDDRLLLIRNSYRPRHSVPGGLVDRGEEPLAAACRETWEEVGIRVDPAGLTACGGVQRNRAYAHFYELEVPTEPAVAIDDREIVWAEFVPRNELGSLPLNDDVRLYLYRRGQRLAADAKEA